jgi:hypothetical protein
MTKHQSNIIVLHIDLYCMQALNLERLGSKVNPGHDSS